MGELRGHLLPGTSQIILGVWWMYSALRRYFLAKHLQHPHYKYRNTATYPAPVSPQSSVEPWVKIIFSTVGAAVEFGNGAIKGPGLVPGWAIQHAMANLFFTLSGVIDLLARKYPRIIPKHTDHLALAFAMYMKYWIFSNHKHGKGPLENMMHEFLFPLDQAAIIAILLEIFCNESVLPALIRSLMVLLSGTWFFQIGFTLFPISGIVLFDENDHNDLMLVPGIYTLHYIGCILFLLAMTFYVNCSVKNLVRRLGPHPDLSTLDYLVDSSTEFEPETKFIKHP